jgi:hypothetical protein
MKRCIGVIVLAVLMSTGASAQKIESKAPAGVSATSDRMVLQGFSMKILLNNHLMMGRRVLDFGDPLFPGAYGLAYPAGSQVEHLFVAAPTVGGIIDGVWHLSEGYGIGASDSYFIPDSRHPLREQIWKTSVLAQGEPNHRDVDDDGDGKVDEDELDGLDNDGDWVRTNDDVGADGVADPAESGCRGGYDALQNPDPAGDDYNPHVLDICHPDAAGNFRTKSDSDAFTENNGIPDHGEPHVDEDYAAISESDYFMSATDTMPSFFRTPMGLKITQKSYAWSSRYGEAILPMEYTVVNIGTKTITDGFVALYADPDVGPSNDPGYFGRNYSCYIPELRTGYSHNPIDRGSTPLGLTLLSAWKPLDHMKVSFRPFEFVRIGPGDPRAIDSILYIGIPFPEPMLLQCGSPTEPIDTKWITAFSTFETLAPGDSIHFVVAFVSGFGVSAGEGSMEENAKRAIALAGRAYHVPSPPPSPKLRVAGEQHQVRLNWSWDGSSTNPLDVIDPYDTRLQALPDTHWRRRDNPDPQRRGGRPFEGYTIWRSESPDYDSASFYRIAQFDVDDDLGYGAQRGLRYSYVDSTVRPGRVYWYAVTSYAVPESWPVVQFGRPPDSTRIEIPGLESPVGENATRISLGFNAAGSNGQVLVVPNPYRSDNKYPGGVGLPAFEGASHGDNGLVWFIHLPAKATIRVFSLTGDAIATLDHDDAARASRGQYTGQEEWRILSDSGLPLASGVYVFSVESDLGTQIGKFVILR